MDILKQRGYQEFTRIDAGGQGNVYRTTKDGRDFAIKVIPVTTSDAILDNDLRRELSITRRLRHPNCMRVEDLFRTKTRVYMVMRYMPNGTIGAVVRRQGPLCEWNCKVWFCPIAKAIAYLHANAIAHRDLKLDNVLLDIDFNPIVADFGFSRTLQLFGHDRRPMSASNTYCGTVSYNPPEILRRIPYNPMAGDVWCLGVALFIMINRVYPFDRHEGANRMFERMCKRDYHLQPEIEQKTSVELLNLIHILLEPNPRARPKIENVCIHPWFPIILQEAAYLNSARVLSNPISK